MGSQWALPASLPSVSPSAGSQEVVAGPQVKSASEAGTRLRAGCLHSPSLSPAAWQGQNLSLRRRWGDSG